MVAVSYATVPIETCAPFAMLVSLSVATVPFVFLTCVRVSGAFLSTTTSSESHALVWVVLLVSPE